MEDYLTSLHAIEERLKSAKPALTFYFDKATPKTESFINMAKRRKVAIQQTDRETLKKMGGFHMALSIPAHSAAASGLEWLKKELGSLARRAHARIAVLDSITDPHNLGAILRSACLFDIDLAVYPTRRAAQGDTDTVSRVSAGGVELVKNGSVPNLKIALELMKQAGFWIYGADMAGKPIAEALPLNKKSVLVLGSEGKGLSQLVRKSIDETVSVPSNGKLDSLNVSVAAGILFYEAAKSDKAKNRASGRPGQRKISQGLLTVPKGNKEQKGFKPLSKNKPAPAAKRLGRSPGRSR